MGWNKGMVMIKPRMKSMKDGEHLPFTIHLPFIYHSFTIHLPCFVIVFQCLFISFLNRVCLFFKVFFIHQPHVLVPVGHA